MSKSDTNDPGGPGLGRLYADRRPPRELEDRVMQAVRSENALVTGARRPSTPRSGRRRVGLIAAGLGLFLAGSLVGRATKVTAGPEFETAAGQPFMLLLWEDDGFSAGPSGSVAAEYAAWAEGIARTGTPISGDELGPALTVGSPEDADEPVSGPRIGGYFFVHADDAESAALLARNHPHVAHGGWIEVAPILQR